MEEQNKKYNKANRNKEYKYKNKSKTVTFEEIESSSLTSKASPKKKALTEVGAFFLQS